MNRQQLIQDIRDRFQQTSGQLNERERRLWAAAEVMRLGTGGMSIVCAALRMSPNTIRRGIQEIADGKAMTDMETEKRVRKPGGGRKPAQRQATDEQNDPSAESSVG